MSDLNPSTKALAQLVVCQYFGARRLWVLADGTVSINPL